MENSEKHTNHHKGWWIPIELERFGLSKIEQFLLSIIDNLDGPNHCSASNAYLANQMDLSLSRISFYITKFKKMGLIEEVSFSGRIRILRAMKENWYALKKQDSKKESYVKTRRQTTRFQEGRLRENTHHIIKDIEKRIDDDDVPAGHEPPSEEQNQSESFIKKIVFRHKTKNVISKSEEEVIAYLKSNGFLNSEISEAIKSCAESRPVLVAETHNVIEKYLESVIEKNRLKTKQKEYNNANHRTKSANRNATALQRSSEALKERARLEREKRS